MKKNTNYTPANRGELVEAIMSRELLMLSPQMRAKEALERLRQVGLPQDFMSNCYVVGEDFALLGLITVRDLIMAQDNQRLENIMEQPKATLAPEDDRERAVRLMDKMDVVELPVVDGDYYLKGTVTADDVMDVMQAETTEDMEIMAAIMPSEQPYLSRSVWSIYRSRVFWLLLLMLSATVTGGIIMKYESALAAQVVLTAFIPMLMDTSGNCGSQSSVTVIRGLSLGDIQFSDWLRVAWKEMRVGVLCGVTLAVVNFLRIAVLQKESAMVALVVSLTLFVAVVISKLLGCCLPILASKLGFDPAVMASPLLTTIADAISLTVYFTMATTLLKL